MDKEWEIVEQADIPETEAITEATAEEPEQLDMEFIHSQDQGMVAEDVSQKVESVTEPEISTYQQEFGIIRYEAVLSEPSAMEHGHEHEEAEGHAEKLKVRSPEAKDEEYIPEEPIHREEAEITHPKKATESGRLGEVTVDSPSLFEREEEEEDEPELANIRYEEGDEGEEVGKINDFHL